MKRHFQEIFDLNYITSLNEYIRKKGRKEYKIDTKKQRLCESSKTGGGVSTLFLTLKAV
jgi:hypothetical protein